ncbi:metallophosphoesterase [Nigerium massiliense]|uniref:metallophosphoesterase n=1 Tax=Nigerium massiliense TaxID=1522317 RepID=UPI000693B3EE|nr:metallophosphoesterase [Nigerium massiliense]
MKTKAKLTHAYETATVIDFDDDSKFVFFSDTHRGDGSKSDEFARNKNLFNAALAHYDAEGFALVEAGDNDDLWEFKYRHILRANPQTFEQLRRLFLQGRYYRLYGNHDLDLRDPAVVKESLSRWYDQFTDSWHDLMPGLVVHQALLFRHRETNQEILTVHGHQGDFSNDQNWRMTRLSFRLFWRYLHAFGFNSPSSPVRNSFKRHKVERNFAKWIRDNRVPLICGHTHRERFPRRHDLPYFNTGAGTFPDSITCLEISGGTIALVRWRVEPDSAGYLHVARSVMAGPQPLATYDLRDSEEKTLAESSKGRRIRPQEDPLAASDEPRSRRRPTFTHSTT